jgi:hypothetical protein
MTYSKRTLEGNLVLVDVLNGGVGDRSLAILQDRRNVDGLPADGGLVAGVSWVRDPMEP